MAGLEAGADDYITKPFSLAVLRARVNTQLKRMLMLEGVFYAGIAILISIVLILAIEPLMGRMLESLLWFFEYQSDITAVWITAPLFLVMGILLPTAVYRMIAKRTIVERLREAE